MQATNEITNAADVLDSRDIIARIDYLAYLDDEPATDDNADERAELAALRALADDAEGYSDDWRHGATLIRDSYFQDYAQDLAEDCDMIPAGLSWPCTCIDWEQAALELQMDYTAVEFGGVTYWVR